MPLLNSSASVRSLVDGAATERSLVLGRRADSISAPLVDDGLGYGQRTDSGTDERDASEVAAGACAADADATTAARGHFTSFVPLLSLSRRRRAA